MNQYLWAYSRISRYEYLKAVVPALIIGTLLAAKDMSFLSDPFYYIGITSIFLTYMSGFVVNALSDYEIDTKYGTYKSETPRAVDTLGKRTVQLILWGPHVLLPILITAYIAFTRGPFLLLPLLLVGYFFGLGYSLKPFQFKVRGVWHIISLATSAIFLPLMYIYLLVGFDITSLDFMIIIGFTVLHYSLTITNQAVDYFEDSRYGVHNPTVVFGLTRSLRYTLAGMVLGFLILVSSIGLWVLNTAPNSALLQPYGPIPAIIGGVVIMLGYKLPFEGTYKLLRIAQSHVPDENKSNMMKRFIDYSRWQASGILAMAVVIVLVFTSIQVFPFVGPKIVKLPDDATTTMELSKPLITISRDDFSYIAACETELTNTGDVDALPGSLEVVYTLQANGISRRMVDTLDTMIPANTSISLRKAVPLFDVSESTLNISLYLCHADGVIRDLLDSKEATIYLNDLYFSMPPKITTNTGPSILSASVSFSAINLGEVRENVMVRVTAYMGSVPIANITTTAQSQLTADYNWSDALTLTMPLYNDILIVVDLLHGLKLVDRYSQVLEIHPYRY